MLQNLPFYLPVSFVLIALIVIYFIYKAIQNIVSFKTRVLVLGICVVWLALQAALGYTGVYSQYPDAMPPLVVVFGILPTIGCFIGLFANAQSRAVLLQLPTRWLTGVHVVRIPVEFGLWGLYLHGAVPQLMTFEGRNPDILAGISALAMLYWSGKPKWLFWWNLAGLGLLINIVVNALLSAPSPIQQFGFKQPNIAVLYFPMCWLPTFIVPMVLLAHLVALMRGK